MNIVRELCVRRGITQKELSLTVGVSQPTVSDWFNNKTDPSGKRLEKLAEIFGVSRAVILGYDDDPMAPVLAVDVSGSMKQGKPETEAIVESIMAKLAQLDEEDRRAAEGHIDFLLERKRKSEA